MRTETRDVVVSICVVVVFALVFASIFAWATANMDTLAGAGCQSRWVVTTTDGNTIVATALQVVTVNKLRFRTDAGPVCVGSANVRSIERLPVAEARRRAGVAP